MDRTEAYNELIVRIQDPEIIKHSLAVEAVMRAMAKHFNEDAEMWGIAGLMHDVDYEKTLSQPEKRSEIGAEILDNLGFDSSIVYTVKAHNDIHGIERKRKMDKALYSANFLTSAILEAAKRLPSKKIQDITPEFVMAFLTESQGQGEKNHRHIKECNEMGVSVEQFLSIARDALIAIPDKLEP